MKKFILFLAAAVSLQFTAFSQSDKYVTTMKNNLSLFDSAKTVEDFTKLANTFERIGDAEKTQWLPYYYAGLALTTSGWMPELKDKDANSARINALCDKAESIATTDADKAELLSIRNMSATQQMMVDPQTRWMSYGQTAGQQLQKALKLDPNNPRLYYLQGMSLFGTPVQFGGGKDKAKPVFEKAVQLYKDARPKELYPRWGQKQAEDMIVQCNQ
jgi:tetratricopeptide (TPR) repeat protein